MVRAGLKAALIAAILLLAQPGHSAPVADRQWSTLAARLLPALSAFEQSPASKSISSNILLAERRKRIVACGQVAGCALKAAIWTEAEIADLAGLVDRSLDGSARKQLAVDDGVQAQATRELKGLNAIVQVYGLRAVPRYPQIDGPIDPPGSAQFNATLADAMMVAEAGYADPVAAIDPSVAVAFALLDANDAAEPVAFEPLDQHNGAAKRASGSIDWKLYRYTAILAPGIGPTDPATPLSARGKLNVRLAASRFAEGLAPFIIVSGSGVHPKSTRFVEAVEMRKALVERYGVPADRVLIEPYARHTTTNLRNATRLLVGLGAPLDRDVLITSNPEQLQYIEGPDFAARSVIELGYASGAATVRLTPTELTFRPTIASLRIDPSDPLDP
jgi:hypothetical protein